MKLLSINIHVVISWKDGLWLSLDPQKGHNHTIKEQEAW